MVTLPEMPQNPFASLQNEVIAIRCHNKELDIPVKAIRKIYLSKYKHGYFPSFISSMLEIPNTSYNLHIELEENPAITLRINSFERFFFIRLIYLLRHSTPQGQLFAMPQQKIYPELSVAS